MYLAGYQMALELTSMPNVSLLIVDTAPILSFTKKHVFQLASSVQCNAV
jgi:hypothetical protein